MNICRFSIVRPVATIVLILILMVFGTISFKRLTVREYPNIEIPVVSVRTTYPGASASVIESKITQIVEDTIAGIDGIEMIESSSSDGESTVTVEFAISRDIDDAANDMRDRVARVMGVLPEEADAPVISKVDAASMAGLIIGITSDTMNSMELTDYADRYYSDRFSVIEGVANVRTFGEQRQAMRIWLKPEAMAARNITFEDVEAALLAENVESPAGRIESVTREFTVRVTRPFSTADEFSRLVIKRRSNGDLIRMLDIADVRLEPRQVRSSFSYFGKDMAGIGGHGIGLGLYKHAKGNALVISKAATKLVTELNKTAPPGVNLFVRRDEALFINESIKEVKGSLLVSSVLVIAIIFLFLGNLRAALIPSITVPISLICSFMVLYACGYSLNILTLLALVLAIGIVVDDAIVVLENVHRRIK
ncbi:MAG: efflux RND transporter permease subunit, partial [bacterium]